MNIWSRSMALGLVVLVSCGNPEAPTPMGPPGARPGATDVAAERPSPPDEHSETAMNLHSASTGDPAENAAPEQLRLVLSEGSPDVAEPVLTEAAVAVLGPEEVQAIFDRLPPVASVEGDQQDFALRPGSLPRPKTGETVKVDFPPAAKPDAPDAAQAGPLEVVRRSPDGEVGLAPHLSLTFNQPMVALTAHDDLAKLGVPVKLMPEPDGQWRWVGTKTLLFEPKLRFPMATKYTAEVPSGTPSAVGGSLAAPVTWSFSTPPPTLQTSWPTGGPHRRNPTMVMVFDQAVDPDAILGHVTVKAGGSNIAIVKAKLDALGETADQVAEGAAAGRWVAFRAEKLLPADATVTVTVGEGAPSAEGPLVTTKAQEFTFRTYGPMRVSEARCGWGDTCRPFTPWTIRFTNAIDEESFDPTMVTVTPDLPGQRVEVYGDTLSIRGLTAGRTKYTVKLAATLPDTFGQTLGSPYETTFDVGSAPEAMWTAGGPFAVLDPKGKPVWTVYSTNVPSFGVKLYKVGPAEWEKFVAYMRDDARDEERPAPPGKEVLSTTIEPGGKPDELVETGIDLTPALSDGLGHAVVVVERISYEPSMLERLKGRKPRWQREIAWVQSTRIALDALVDPTELVGWATSLADGKPIEGVELTIEPKGSSGTTDAQGLATMPLTDTGRLLIAKKGSDIALLPRTTSWWDQGSGWQKTPQSDFLRWYVFDDRGMYKPKETVHVKGWVRLIGAGERGDVGAVDGAASSARWIVRDSRYNEIAKGEVALDPWGGFSLELPLPDTMNLGHARLELSATGGSVGTNGTYTHTFQVQEFRRPEFEVSARASEGPHFVGGAATVTAKAAYYAGGGLPNAEVQWSVTASPGWFSPPNRGDFVFGTWTPWWMSDGGADGAVNEAFSARTDASGEHNLRVGFAADGVERPQSVTAEASIMDVNRQQWNASASLLVHPAAVYVGLRTERTFVQKGDDIEVALIAVDLDGVAMPDRPLAVRAVREEWVYEKGKWATQELDPKVCEVRSAKDPVSCTFEAEQGGRYRISARVTDSEGRGNRSELSVWVAGGKQPPPRGVEKEALTLIPDKETYAPGDVAELLVQSPFYPAEGLVTTQRSGIWTVERITLDGPSAVVRVPIVEGHVPNVVVDVLIVGAAVRTGLSGEPEPSLPRRPAFAQGALSLRVPPLMRELALEVAPAAEELEPGANTTVSVTVTGADGKPAEGAQVAVVVVDEAVLALSSYKLSDPLAIFYSARSGATGTYSLRSSVLLASMADLAEQGAENMDKFQQQAEDASAEMEEKSAGMPPPAPMARMAMKGAMEPAPGGGGAQPIKMRTDFSALATFAPAETTDAEGRLTVAVKLPDNLTRYRVMAVAVQGGKRFGKAESAITARLPLMVRPSAPRFLNFGDTFQLPIVLQNQTDAPLDVSIAVRATNAELTAGQGRRVTVPAKDRVEVRFPAAAAKAGTARFQLGAVTGDFADAAEVSLPVWTPATTEAFATYGEIDKGSIVQPVAMPSDVYPQFGGLEISTSSTAMQALTDAVLYLVAYPFECSEQLSSRVLAVAALRDVLTAFEAEGAPSPEEMIAAVGRDIERLRGLQNYDGGFGFWRRGDESWPYLSIHVAHALGRAKQKGFEVPEQMTSRSLTYLRSIESHIPSRYGADARRSITAYALYVRGVLGDVDAAGAKKLLAEAPLEKMPFEALAWLLNVLAQDGGAKADVERLVRFFENRATETAGTAHFASSYGDDGYLLLHSDRRADGIILEALIAAKPDSDLIPKVVRGLMAHRTKGRWGNTQENAFVLLALDRYFGVYEKETPDFVARVWLGDDFAGDHTFEGRTTETAEINVPMQWLAAKEGEVPLTLQKDGKGRLYYRLGMRYAPKSLMLAPADHGFTVERSYEAVEDAGDVKRGEDGVWHIKAGTKVRVRLTMVASARRYHVALVDPLPAGLEPMNPALAVTGSVPQDPKEEESRGGHWWWYRPWYEHQNLRDERAEAFTSLLWEGVHTYTYVARATTPGEFVVPPTKAEEMYHPETFGRAASDRVVVD